MEMTNIQIASIILASLFCGYISISFGIGYGTILTPILLITGFHPLQIIPAVLFSQLLSSITGGILHHKQGNINLDFHRDKNIGNGLRSYIYIPKSQDAKVVFILALCSILGVSSGVVIAVNIPTIALETYIGLLVLFIGILVLMKKIRAYKFSWKSLFALGLISSINKGMTGGGYLPLLTGGQIISGQGVKSAVGNTTVAVTFSCVIGFLCYLLLNGLIFWPLAIYTCIGAIISTPFAAISTKKIKTEKLKMLIGSANCTLGILTLVKVFIF